MTNRIALLLGLLVAAPATAAPLDPELYAALKWRGIGPFRGGRTVGATGVPDRPNLFYIGVNNGGVWKSTDAGRVWVPIFDDQPTGSIGAIAVAPSNPDVIYVGSGEGLQRPDLSTGDGLYKSTDGGKTWTNTGLRDGQQISSVIVDPKDPNRVFVAVLGHPYNANPERGVFRTTDGGKTWAKVLYKDEDTGAVALAFDPKDPTTVYTVLWASRQGPWENGAWQGPGSGLFKSTDGGTTWKQLTTGLPTTAQGLGRIGFDVSRSDPKRLYAVVDAPRLGGIYRSDDAGDSWRRVNSEARVWGRGSDFAEVKVDPKNPDVIWVANTSLYKSTDAGVSFTCVRGAPGGDDYHTVWINPDDPNIVLLAGDQGAVITVNGGSTWSSWYNQPTAQFYHVITDNRFPYWVYGAQQESGSACVASRGDWGQITQRDWHTVGIEEYGYVAPDPLNPDIVFGGKVEKFDRRTGQVQNVAPAAARRGEYRFLRTASLIFSPVDPKALYLGSNVLFKTTTGGHSWEVISPDLSRPSPDVPESIGVYRTPEMTKMPRRGVIYTVGPSYLKADTIWAGTDDGLIHVTPNGGRTWTDVTPPGLTAWSKVSLIDAGRFDAATAYAAINRIRLGDQRPHVYRTDDGGKSWTEIVRGLPANAPVNVVREDPVRKGLLFAGTERAVFVSFNDGDDWQNLRLNMPATSVRDLVVHKNDVVVGTHGRGFWILDDISPLRELTAEVAADPVHLFRPAAAYRVRRSVNTDTPLPPDEPTAPNPPDGAIIDYWLRKPATGPVVLEIQDHDGNVVRRFSSADPAEPVDPKTLNIDSRWVRPPRVVSSAAGIHRFVWDLHYPPPTDSPRRYPISAVYGDTPSEPFGPVVMPGDYTARLTVDGKTLTQPLTIKMDPRVNIPPAELKKQYRLSMQCYEGSSAARTASTQARSLRAQAASLRAKAGELVDALAALESKLGDLDPATGGPSLGRTGAELGRLLGILQGADAVPTAQTVTAVEQTRADLEKLLGRWAAFRDKELPAMNARLKAAGLATLDPAVPAPPEPKRPRR
jgi:photosystem II stability/assembly factor-like uncharacterized protein